MKAAWPLPIPTSDRTLKIPLLPGVTPLEAMPRLGERIGLKHLYIKRDDEGGRGGGGNKLRKFERQFADLLEQNADTVIIAAHPQSNAARELAGTAVRFGLRPLIVMKRIIARETVAFETSGNRLLLDLLGAELIEISSEEDFDEAIARVEADLRARGAKPYTLPFGASNTAGILGYADCATEILQQTLEAEGRFPDLVIVPTGSGGTHAGLMFGFARAGVSTEVLGFTILQQPADAIASVQRLLEEALRQDSENDFTPPAIQIAADALGAGYGIPTSQGLETIRLVASLEGIFLDPVYTGKAMAGLIARRATGEIDPDALVVFIHTGGLPLLFAYSDIFQSVGEQ